MRRMVVSLLLALCGFGAFAGEAVPLAANAAVEERLLAIADELRCLVCQNESLAASCPPSRRQFVAAKVKGR